MESFRTMDDETYEKLKIPLKLAQMIQAKIRSFDSIDKPLVIKEEKPIEKPKETMIEKKIKSEKSPESNLMNEEHLFVFLLKELKSVTQTDENYRQTLNLIKTLIKNIISNPLNANFKKIKLSNKKFNEVISPYPPALDLLRGVYLIFKEVLLSNKILKVGFEFNNETMFLSDENTNLFALNIFLEQIINELTLCKN